MFGSSIRQYVLYWALTDPTGPGVKHSALSIYSKGTGFRKEPVPFILFMVLCFDTYAPQEQS